MSQDSLFSVSGDAGQQASDSSNDFSFAAMPAIPKEGPGAAIAGTPALPGKTPIAANTSDAASATPGATDVLAGLNGPQRAAVTYDGDYLLVVAGAGSGKTRVLTTRISYLIASGQLAPSEVLAITFTNKAAKEMRERLNSILGATARRMWISTFHSACLRIMRAEHETLRMSSAFSIYDTLDSQRLIKIVCREEGVDPKQYPPKKLGRLISDLKNEMVSDTDYEAIAQRPEDQVLAQVYRGYQSRLRAANAVDFDDIIMLTVQLLRDHPQLAEHYRLRFRHVLVDEYQDTNTAQYQLLKALVGTEDDLNHSKLTVVGDADQSIYAFRGATIRNIENFEEDFPGAAAIVLEQNYRSTQNILSAANAVIANNTGRHPKNLWTNSGTGEKLVGYVADAESDEAAFVVEEVTNLRHAGFRYGDIAVFYRTNAQSRALEEMFVRSGIPYKVVGGTKFYERKEIKDALAYLQAIANPDDTVSLRRIINEPRRGLGDKAVSAVAHYAQTEQISFGAALQVAAGMDAAPGSSALVQVTPRARKSITSFVETMAELRAAATAGDEPAKILEDVLDQSGYLTALQDSKDPQDEVRVENLAELHAVAADFSVLNPEGTLAEFLDQISLVSDTDQLPEESGGEVVLMTVHTAKGLEFPVVFVTGLEDGTFPHIRALNSAQEEAEERRLAYVALTRARQRLYLTRAAARSQWGAPQELPASRFLAEIPPEIIDWRRTESAMDTLRAFGSATWGGSWGRRRKPRDFSYDDDDFAPPIGASKFVPGKLGMPTKSNSSAPGKTAEQTEPDSPPHNSGAPSTGGLAVGDKVRHKSFGMGRILAFEGSGRSTVAEVRFTNGATKRLMLRFAPLEKV